VGIVARATSVPIAVGLVHFQKITLFLYELDGDKLYTELVAFKEIYNFVVQTFLI
jgi:hypothetical protein